MSEDIEFKDTVTLYAVRKNGWGKDVLQPGVEVPAVYEQSTDAGHTNHQDFVGSDGILILPPDNEFLIANGYRLEDMIAKINVFGYDGAEQYFRLGAAVPMRDTLLDNKVQHVECGLEKVSDPNAGAIS